jgi:hypothetical protein
MVKERIKENFATKGEISVYIGLRFFYYRSDLDRDILEMFLDFNLLLINESL